MLPTDHGSFDEPCKPDFDEPTPVQKPLTDDVNAADLFPHDVWLLHVTLRTDAFFEAVRYYNALPKTPYSVDTSGLSPAQRAEVFGQAGGALAQSLRRVYDAWEQADTVFCEARQTFDWQYHIRRLSSCEAAFETAALTANAAADQLKTAQAEMARAEAGTR